MYSPPGRQKSFREGFLLEFAPKVERVERGRGILAQRRGDPKVQRRGFLRNNVEWRLGCMEE
jgi:hypothetical protein